MVLLSNAACKVFVFRHVSCSGLLQSWPHILGCEHISIDCTPSDYCADVQHALAHFRWDCKFVALGGTYIFAGYYTQVNTTFDVVLRVVRKSPSPHFTLLHFTIWQELLHIKWVKCALLSFKHTVTCCKVFLWHASKYLWSNGVQSL
jgi:hypothetical protein